MEHHAPNRTAVRWLHIPKTGSNFGLTVLTHACADSVPAWRLAAAALGAKACEPAAALHAPAERAFAHIRHCGGLAHGGDMVDIRLARAIGERPPRSERRPLWAAYGHALCGGKLVLPFGAHEPLRADEPAPVRGSGAPATLVVVLRRARIAQRRHTRSGASGKPTPHLLCRRPAQRLISAFLDNYHADGIARAERNRMKAAAPTVAAWARYPGVSGCMAKMLAGKRCAAQHARASPAALLQRALARLASERTFVALVEQWDLSVCLLHRMLGSAPPVAAELRRLGRTSAAAALGPAAARALRLRDGSYNESLLGGFVDELDERVYSAGTRVFWSNAARFPELLRHAQVDGAAAQLMVEATRRRNNPHNSE